MSYSPSSNTIITSAGSSLVGDTNTYSHFTPLSATVKGALSAIDLALGGTGSNSFDSSLFNIFDHSDNTKQLAFIISNIGHATIRTITMPNANVDLGNLTDSNISASAGIVYSKLNLAGNIVNSDINASAAIAYSKLALVNSIMNADINASAAIAYSKLALANSIMNSDINSAAAIAYSKLSLSGSIINSDISGSAAIVYSKLNLSASIQASDQNSQSATSTQFLAANGSGGAAYRSIASGDLPSLSSIYLALSGGTMSGVLDMGSNKIINISNGTNPGDAVNYSQLTSISTGLVWQAAINDPDLVNDSLSIPPVSPVYSITYIIAASPTGAWVGCAGHATWWDGAEWIDLSTGNTLTSGLGTAVQIGDRFAVAIASAGGPAQIGGGLTGLHNYIVTVTGNTPGSFTYSTTAPVNNYAVSVLDTGSQHYGSSFTYVTSSTSWIDFSGPSKVVAGNALAYTGNTLNVLFDGITIDLISNQLEVKNNGISNAKLAQMAAHTYKGNNTGSTANAADITSTQLTADLNLFTPSLQGLVPGSGGGTSNFLRADGNWTTPANSGGTVTTVSVITANGISGSVANPTTTPAITLSLGAISPSSVSASGSVTGSNLSGTNSGDVTLAAVGSSPNANAASLSGQILNLQPFSSAFPGVVGASGGGTANFLRADGTWTTPPNSGGTVTTVSVINANGVSASISNPTTTPALTFTLGAITPSSVAATGTVTGSNLSGTNTGDQTITLTGDVTGSGTGSFAATIANSAVTNAKLSNMAAHTVKANNTGSSAAPSDVSIGSLTEATSSILTITGGTNSVIGNVSIQVSEASGSASGYLSSTDWNTFNNKQAAGNYITALTGDVAASGPGSASATIQPNVVSNSKLAQMAAHTYKGNNTGSTANAADITSTQLTADLNQFTSSLQGLVPGSGGGTSNFLRADGTWTIPPNSGGTVTSVSVVTANGVSASVSNPTTTPALTFTLGAITPSSVAATGTVTGSNLSGTNTGDQTITLTGDVTGSGTGSFAATIANSAVTNAKMANMANNTVKANISGSSAAPSDVSAVSAASASTFMVRDTNANTQINTIVENIATTATASGTTTLLVSSAPLQQFTGTSSQTLVLPDATTLIDGWQYQVFNRSTGNITVNVNGGGLLQTMAAGSQAIFTLISNGVSAGTWDVSYTTSSASNAITALTGDATATGPGSAALTLATVNSNVGSFGSASSVGSFTVNAKGLITAASNTSIQITESQVTNLTSDLSGKLSSALTQNDIFVGNASNIATGVAMSGDVGIVSSGATTIQPNVVSNSKLAQMATLTIKGNNTGGTANASDLTVAQVNAILPVFTSTLNGLAPLSGGGTTNYLRADGTWDAPPGATSGTVTSVSVVTANGISGSVATATTTPAITLTLGAITPNSVSASGTISGSNLTSGGHASLDLALSGGTMSGAINMGSNQINALASPTLSTDAATKGYVDAAISGLTWKGPVAAYATSNVPLTGSTPLVIDGYTVLNGDLLLLSAQSTASQDGEYAASITGGSYTLTANGLPNAVGDAWLVSHGTVYANSAFVATAVVPAATFVEFAGPTALVYSSPLSISGNTVSISQANTSTNGYLSSTDWNTFNNKQAAGNYITALTGDATASGPGSSILTLATVNSNVGTFTKVTVNAKGLITAATSIASSDLPTITLTGDVTGAASGGSIATTIANNAVTNAKFRQSAGLSVVGNSGSSTANVADITGTSNQVLVVNSGGTSLGFGAVNLASASAVTGTLANSNTTATNAATASTIVSRDANSNTQVNAVIENISTTATAAGTTTLTVSSSPLQQFTGSSTQTLILPNATTLVNGWQYSVFNRSTGTVTVNANGGGLLQSMAGGSQATFTLVSNGTSAGTWDVSYTTTGAANAITALTGDVAATGPGSVSSTIQSNVVSNSKLAQMAANTIKGNNTGSTANASDLSVANVLTMLGIRAGSQSVSSAASSVSVTFSTAYASTSYAIHAMFVNTTDTNPQFQPIDITAQSTTGFTAKWNSPTDTANYSIQYITVGNN